METVAKKKVPTIYDIRIRKGMTFKLKESNESTQAKKGDIVKVTSVKAMGMPFSGYYNDYEQIRVSNGKFSWRISRESLQQIA